MRRHRGGHHNVFFRRPGFERVPVLEAPTLTQLYRGLRQKHDPADVLIIPHAHQNGDWRQSDPKLETLVEIMLMHGSFESFMKAYLANGHQVGVLAASDDHLSHPGGSCGISKPTPRRRGIWLRSSRTRSGVCRNGCRSGWQHRPSLFELDDGRFSRRPLLAAKGPPGDDSGGVGVPLRRMCRMLLEKARGCGDRRGLLYQCGVPAFGSRDVPLYQLP